MSDKTDIQGHISQNLNAILMLNSSCQAVVENYIAPSNSPWYPAVSGELSRAQDLVREWRLSGYLYFGQSIISSTLDCANAILGAKPSIESMFGDLSGSYSEELKQKLVNELNGFKPKIQNLSSSLVDYEGSLRAWNIKMEKVHKDLSDTIGKIQAQEASLQADIQANNIQIESMRKTVEQDRRAIAKAKSERSKGIVETIFGVILAPVTGGASLILAGIGVSSIVEGEAKVKALESDIRNATNRITADQAHLSDDQRQIVSLQGISTSAAIVLSDVDFIGESLDLLRTDWELLHQNLEGVVSKVEKATDAKEIIVSKLWFESACNEWSAILDYVKTFQGIQIDTTKVSIQ